MEWIRRRKKGFTIIELLVVILIISMLAVFVAPRFYKGLGKAKRDIARSQMAIIENAIGRFYLDCERYPDDSVGLDELLSEPEDVTDKWMGPYLKPSEILDPWKKEFDYRLDETAPNGAFILRSYGADGAEGGEQDNEDIIND